MDNTKKAIMTIVLVLGVMFYTVMNYINGKTDFTMFLVCIVILGISLVNMFRILIEERKK